MSTLINIYLKMKEEQNRLTKELEAKDSTIETLTKQITDEVAISAAAIVERDRLRKELEEAQRGKDVMANYLNELMHNTSNMVVASQIVNVLREAVGREGEGNQGEPDRS